MSTMFKYRVHEVAKDFKMQTKQITEILTKYAEAPKNHMHILSIGELDIIFEYLTSHNQMDEADDIFVDSAAPEQAEPVAEKDSVSAKPEPTATESTLQSAAPTATSSSVPSAPASASVSSAPQATPTDSADSRKIPKKADKPFMPHRVPQKRVIDTSGATINLSKYDERLDNLVPERAEKMTRGKEKIVKKARTQQQSMVHGVKNARKNETECTGFNLKSQKRLNLKL